MPRFRKDAARQSERRTDEYLRDLLAAYADRRASTGSRAGRAHLDATQSVDDLAFHQPEIFWRFCEIATESDVSLEDLGDLGWGPLTWLLRLYPDTFAKRVADAAHGNPRMRSIVAGVDPDRVAPDVWRRLQKVSI